MNFYLQEHWDSLTGWTETVINGGVTEIDPAGQLHLDLTSATGEAEAIRYQDVGSLGTGEVWTLFRIKGDTWDGFAGSSRGFKITVEGTTSRIVLFMGNGHASGDGMYLYDGSAFNKVYAHTWDNDWHTVQIRMYNSQTDADIYVDGVKEVTAADCSASPLADGNITVLGYGTVAGDGEYHLDYLEVADSEIPIPVPIVPADWAFRRKVTVSNTNIDSDLTHFPLLLTLGTSVGTGNTDVSSIFDELGTGVESFDTYANGNLNGKGDWVGDDSYSVQETTVYEGTKAIETTTVVNDYIAKAGSDVATGSLSFYIRATATDGEAFLNIREGTSSKIDVRLDTSGNIQYYNGSTYVTIQSYVADTWYLIEIEWRSSDHKARYRVDEDTWTDYYVGEGTWTSLNSVRLNTDPNTDEKFYYDLITTEIFNNADRKKIALTKTDGTTQLYGEIEKWDDANETAVIWVSKSDLVLASGDTTDIYMYYDSTQDDNTTYIGDTNAEVAENVWDSYYKMVQHMADGANTSGTYDSTGNDHDGTKYGAAEPATTTGQIGNAQDFDGTDDQIHIADSADFAFLSTDSFSLELWFKGAVNEIATLLEQRGIVGHNYTPFTGIETTADGYANFVYMTEDEGGDPTIITSSVDICDDAWHKVTVVRNVSDDKIYLYVDGASAATAVTDASTGDFNSTNVLTIGCYNYGSTNYAGHFNGDIDEVRISKGIVRSAAWIKANYYSETDALVAWGTEEEPSGPADLKSMNTVLKANIKSINSIAIADVKSVNTIE